jgi:hypothetical protein
MEESAITYIPHIVMRRPSEDQYPDRRNRDLVEGIKRQQSSANNVHSTLFLWFHRPSPRCFSSELFPLFCRESSHAFLSAFAAGCFTTVPNENSARPASDAIPRGEAKSVSRSRPCLSLANEIRRCTRVQVSTVRTLISKPRGETARSLVDSGLSGSPSFVAVVQSADLRHHHDGPHFRRLNRSWLW